MEKDTYILHQSPPNELNWLHGFSSSHQKSLIHGFSSLTNTLQRSSFYLVSVKSSSSKPLTWVLITNQHSLKFKLLLCFSQIIILQTFSFENGPVINHNIKPRRPHGCIEQIFFTNCYQYQTIMKLVQIDDHHSFSQER